MIDFNKSFTGAKLTLRPIQIEDFESYLKLTQDESMWIYFTANLAIEPELKQWVDDALTQTKHKTRLTFSIINNGTGNIIGSTSFGNISDHDQRIEIGWTWIAKNFQGKGYNDEMKYIMTNYCFEENDFERVEFKTDVLNIPARKALLKFGATEEGILRSHTLMTHLRRRDTIFYSILKSEWTDLKTKHIK